MIFFCGAAGADGTGATAAGAADAVCCCRCCCCCCCCCFFAAAERSPTSTSGERLSPFDFGAGAAIVVVVVVVVVVEEEEVEAAVTVDDAGLAKAPLKLLLLLRLSPRSMPPFSSFTRRGAAGREREARRSRGPGGLGRSITSLPGVRSKRPKLPALPLPMACCARAPFWWSSTRLRSCDGDMVRRRLVRGIDCIVFLRRRRVSCGSFDGLFVPLLCRPPLNYKSTGGTKQRQIKRDKDTWTPKKEPPFMKRNSNRNSLGFPNWNFLIIYRGLCFIMVTMVWYSDL